MVRTVAPVAASIHTLPHLAACEQAAITVEEHRGQGVSSPAISAVKLMGDRRERGGRLLAIARYGPNSAHTVGTGRGHLVSALAEYDLRTLPGWEYAGVTNLPSSQSQTCKRSLATANLLPLSSNANAETTPVSSNSVSRSPCGKRQMLTRPPLAHVANREPSRFQAATLTEAFPSGNISGRSVVRFQSRYAPR